ncbi:MAG: GIY-YIG nuclease family protein [Hydrogenophaga sp.]|uniref:GIY-YIG nuclease family protein n=1 Tax=Hydrogenophaga sp. TaxID=1904254 RepID=UPI0026149D8C|nr:GIY-YIG nuclease family protein [Hydrogenophaga sp.]MDM7943552.1 GIY-YIG nuclease family protein [Hydrogenophaga sp.]
MPDQTCSHTDAHEFIPLLPYYVYVLTDPRDETVFYVGKGKGERAFNHTTEVRMLIARGTALESAKHRKIREILDCGAEPKAMVVARFDDEQQAHAVESVLINFSYDYEHSLTNSVRGHGAEFVRRFGDSSVLAGIDIPARVRTNDGGFRDKKIEALQAAGAYELLDRIRDQLSARGFVWRNFEAGTPDRPFDPGASNGCLGVMVHIEGIDFMVTFSKACRPGVSVANTPATRNAKAREGLVRIEQELGAEFRVGPPKNTLIKGEGRFRDFEHTQRVRANGKPELTKPTFDPDNLEALFELLGKFRRILGAPPSTPGAA